MYDYQDYENDLACAQRQEEYEAYLEEQADNDYYEWRYCRNEFDE